MPVFRVLMSGAQAVDSTCMERTDDSSRASRAGAESGQVRALDLTAVERIVRGRLPGLEAIYDRFVRGARSAFSRELSVKSGLELQSLRQEKYGAWLKQAPDPFCAQPFSLKPLSGSAALVFTPLLANQLVDVLMGGNGSFASAKRAREYSEIERRLLTKFAALLVELLADAWSPVLQVSAICGRLNTSPQTLNLGSPTDWISSAAISVELAGKCSDLFLLLPMYALGPVKDKLEAGGAGAAPAADSASRTKLTRQLLLTEADVSVMLGKGKITGRELLNLKVGDVIALETRADSDAVVRVEGKPKFSAALGTAAGNKAAIIKSRKS